MNTVSDDRRARARVVLVSIHLGTSPQNVPLGAACVASALKSAAATRSAVEPLLLDALVSETPQALAARILALKPALVGFSVYVWNRALAAATAAELARLAPALPLLAGGAEATADPEGLLGAAPFAAVIAGEGESAGVAAIASALAGAAPEAAAGVFIAGATTPREAPRRAPPENVSALASPWLDGTLDAAPYRGALWELARGCPFGCTYCYESRGHRGVRRFSRERIEAELDAFMRAGIGQVLVLDPTFNAERRRAIELLKLIRDKGAGMHYVIETRAEFLDREQAALFSEIECSVQIGLQSADPAVLAKVGRNLDPSAFARKVGLLNETGAVFGLDLIYGLPGDTLRGFRASVDYALALQPNHLDVFRLSVLPGTALADEADGFGLIRERVPPYRVLGTPEFPAADLDRAERLARSLDTFYVKGRAVAWFARALSVLGGRPAAFFDGFADYIEGSGGFAALSTPRRIEEAQIGYLRQAFAERRKERYLDAVQDLVRLNGAWGRALAEGETSDLELSWDPDLIFGPAALDVRSFVNQYPKRACGARIAPAPGGGATVERLSAGRRSMPFERRGARSGMRRGADHAKRR